MRTAAALGLALLAASACGRRPDPAVRTLALDDGWRFRGGADTTWLPATVPGTVHTDLLAAGVIPDPLRGAREEELRWIEEEEWVYALDVEVDRAMLREDRVELVLEGLDTWATVLLNGERVLEADNMFRTWRVDVRPHLRPGANALEVRFAPPAARGRARAQAHPWPIPHQEPDAGGTRAFSRKAAYHFGWDWGPRYVTSGIWKPVRLEAWSGVRISGVRVASVSWMGADRDSARVRFAVDLEGAAAGGDPIRLGLRSPEGDFPAVIREVEAPPPGAPATVEVDVVMTSPRPWWPRGMGREPGHLHEVAVDAVQGTRWDRRSLGVGLRTVELVTEADSVGESFFFRVNGEPVFARGANVVPPDHFTPRADSAAYARMVDDAVAANMNMLRVWGGGVYLPDPFYDLADRAGILVWQDFMFANALVPGDTAFAASVAAEAEDQVRRLRRHPSIALWCGNNEVAEGWANWGWRDAYAPEVAADVEGAYRRIFEDVLPGVLARLDPGAPYVPSSPRIGWGHPESLVGGDSHYWGVWWGLEPFRVYALKVPRFASEFGFQALPDPATLAAFQGPGAGLPASLGDPVMRAHQKHPTGYGTIRAYLEREWPVPPDDSVDAWSHVSQLAQAEGVGLALEAHRRSWPRTGGTLYWQLNDTWPVVSWSSVDALGSWKALHHRARDVFAPVAVLADAWSDTVAVWVAADEAERAAGTVTIRLKDFAGATLAERSVAVSGPGEAWRGAVDELLPPGADRREVFVEARLAAPGGAPAVRDVAFLAPPKELRLRPTSIEVVSARPRGATWELAMTSRSLVFGVRMGAEGVQARYSDNYLHLLPGDTAVVRVDTGVEVPDFLARLSFRTLNPSR